MPWVLYLKILNRFLYILRLIITSFLLVQGLEVQIAKFYFEKKTTFKTKYSFFYIFTSVALFGAS